MAYFNLEKELHTSLKLDTPLTKGPAPRWERKAVEISTPGLSGSVNCSSNNSTLNVSKNRTCTIKTPSKTPKKNIDQIVDKMAAINLGRGEKKCINPASPSRITSMKKQPHANYQWFEVPRDSYLYLRNYRQPRNRAKKPITPSRNKTNKTPNSTAAGDRFIPNRSAMQFDVAKYVLTQNNDDNENLSPNTSRYRATMSENLNGDLSKFRIMAYQKKAPFAPAGHANELKILYSSSKDPCSSRKTTRHIPQNPEQILDAPEIMDDYYLNLIDWSSTNCLAVALAGNLYVWNASTSGIKLLLQLPDPEDYVCSVSWVKDSNSLAVGTSTGEVQIWDVAAEKRLRALKTHSARVASLSWNSYILSSGSRSGQIHHYDVRIAQQHVGTLSGHSLEVCGLQWSRDGRYLASGGNDNVLNIWSSRITRNPCQPVYVLNDHQAAVKAVSWCPWQSSLLATGGGTADRHIRFWNCNLGTSLNAIDTKSQVCGILWSEEYRELISGHGFVNNELIIWKYPQLNKVAELTGHTARILNLALSADGTTVVSAGADETLRLWNCFAVDQMKKKTATKKKDMRMKQTATLGNIVIR